MTKVHFVGPQTNLGRFGTVRRGDVLDLTNKEAECVAGDKRFRPFDAKAKFTVTDLPLPEGFDDLPADEQTKKLAELQQAEETRKADLEKANLASAGVELDELSGDELLEMASDMKKRGVPVTFQKDATRKTIKAAIELALNVTHRPEVIEEDDSDEGEDPQTIKTPVVPPVPAIPPAGESTGTDAGKTDAESNRAPTGPGHDAGAQKARELPAGLDEMTQAELDDVIAAMKTEGRTVTPAGGKRADKIEAIKAASAVLL